MHSWSWPQWAIVGILVLGDLVEAAKDGEPRTGTYNFSSSVLGTVLVCWILWMGGFFG